MSLIDAVRDAQLADTIFSVSSIERLDLSTPEHVSLSCLWVESLSRIVRMICGTTALSVATIAETGGPGPTVATVPIARPTARGNESMCEHDLGDVPARCDYLEGLSMSPSIANTSCRKTGF